MNNAKVDSVACLKVHKLPNTDLICVLMSAKPVTDDYASEIHTVRITMPLIPHPAHARTNHKSKTD